MTMKLSRFSLSPYKFLNSQKNLSPLKLFPDDPKLHVTHANRHIGPVLDLDNQILQKLERSCTHMNHFDQIHSQLIVLGIFEDPLVAGRCVMKLCTSLGSVSRGVTLYDHIKEPDAFMCNTVMKGLLNGRKDPFCALRFYYEKMIAKGLLPNRYTFPIVAKVCADIGSVCEGQRAHARVVKFGFELDVFAMNSFIRMYAVCGRISDARLLFDNGFLLDTVSWNTMINGYVKNGDVGLARELFDEMPVRDDFSWNSMISGYVGVGNMESAKALFDIIPSRDIVSWNSMIDGYSRMKNVTMARSFFDRMPVRNVVSWNIMLALYQRCKEYGECLKLFDMMIDKGEVRPNEASLVSVLTACANFRRLDKGKWIHSYCKANGIEPDMLLSTSLLTMYAKCGVIDMAGNIFNNMQDKSVVSWNSMIMGYAMHRHEEKALEMFQEMQISGLVPNDATFVSVLHACSQAKMVLEGFWYFHLMHKIYNIEPKAEHYGCMVDLLSRAGFMKQTKELTMKMHLAKTTSHESPISGEKSCLISEIAKDVAEQLIKLDPQDIAPYMLLANLYAVEGKWDDVENVRKEMESHKKEHMRLVDHEDIGLIPCLGNGSLHWRSMIYSMSKELGAQMRLYFMEQNGV